MTGRTSLIAAGLAAGAAVSAVDVFAAGGHVSPVAVVGLLLAVTAAVGAIGGWPAWPGALAAAVPVPGLHAVKHALGLPDTIQPNTWDAIVMMALFTTAVCGAGYVAGALMRMAAADGR